MCIFKGIGFRTIQNCRPTTSLKLIAASTIQQCARDLLLVILL